MALAQPRIVSGEDDEEDEEQQLEEYSQPQTNVVEPSQEIPSAASPAGKSSASPPTSASAPAPLSEAENIKNPASVNSAAQISSLQRRLQTLSASILNSPRQGVLEMKSTGSSSASVNSSTSSASLFISPAIPGISTALARSQSALIHFTDSLTIGLTDYRELLNWKEVKNSSSEARLLFFDEPKQFSEDSSLP